MEKHETVVGSKPNLIATVCKASAGVPLLAAQRQRLWSTTGLFHGPMAQRHGGIKARAQGLGAFLVRPSRGARKRLFLKPPEL